MTHVPCLLLKLLTCYLNKNSNIKKENGECELNNKDTEKRAADRWFWVIDVIVSQAVSCRAAAVRVVIDVIDVRAAPCRSTAVPAVKPAV